MNLSKIDNITKGRVRTTGVSDFLELELHKVYPNPNQPRKNFTDIDELAQSIKTNGLIQPIAVVKKDDGYMIISGERRYRASLHVKLKTIKAHIIQADEKKILELALVENIQRNDLTDFEKAKFINQLWASGNYAKKQDLAAAIGKPASYISKVFKAVNLSGEIIADIEGNKKDIGLEILQELSNIKDEEVQIEVYKTNPTREQIRNAVYIAKENKKYKDLKVPQISPAKKETTSTVSYIKSFDCQITEKESDLTVFKGNGTTITIDYGSRLGMFNKVNTNYKITIEEL